MKKKMFVGIAVFAITGSVAAQETVNVRGHVTKEGVYVPASVRTAPNDTKADNWSTRGNVNPYNGKVGTIDPNAPRPIKPY